MKFTATQQRTHAIILYKGAIASEDKIGRENKFLYLSEAQELTDELNANHGILNKFFNWVGK